MVKIQFVASAIVLAAGGAINAGYLVWKHYQHKPMVCPLNHDCNVITESRWSRIFFVRNEVLGLLFFIGVLAALLASLALPNYASKLYFLIFWGSAAGTLFSAFLTYLQKYIIKDYCFYCFISAVITLLLLMNSLLFIL